MAIIFDSVYMSKNVISLQIKAHEVHIIPLKERESILDFKERDDEDDVESEQEDKQSEEEDNKYEEDEVIEDQISTNFLIQIIVLKINQIFKTHP